MILHSPIISGSLTFADGATFTLPDNGVYSGSFSGSINGIGDPETFSASLDTRIDQLAIDTGSQDSRLSSLEGFTSSIDTTIKTKLDTDVVISGSSQVQFNDVTNNPFSASVGSVTVSKNIVPTTSNLTLGSVTNPFHDLYLSSASLYIDGQQVLSSNTTELILTTDVNQSLKLLETGVDTITLQSQNGNITLTSTGNGTIELDAPIQIAAGNKFLSTDGNNIHFGNGLSITGSISLTGTVDSVDVAGLKSDFDSFSSKTLVSGSSQVEIGSVSGFTSYSSSVDSRINTEKGRVDAILASADADKDSFAEIVTLINSVDLTNDTAFASFYTSSNATNAAQDARLSLLESKTGSIDNVDSAQNARLTSLESFSGSQEGKDSTLSSYTSSIDSKFGTLATYTGSVDAHIASTSNPHSVTKSQVGLGNVENTALSTWAGTSNITTLGTVTSGDVQAILPAGSISGSSQVFSNVSGDVTINSSGVSAISSGVIVNADVNASAAIAYTKLNLQGSGIVSGSSQVSYPSLSNIPSGIVSSSSQVDYNSISNQPTIGNGTVTIVAGTGLDGGGSFTTNQTGASSITLTVADGVVSGSSQVSYPSLSNIPSGIISGSSQLPSGVISGSSQVQAGSITGDIALGTQTSGDYVQNLGTGTGVTIGSNSGEGSTPTIAVNYGSTANTAVEGNTSITFAGTSNEITIDGGSSITLGSGGTVTYGLADTIGGNRTFSGNVTVSGNLTVNGTTTTVNSNTVNIGDNILVLNSDETGTPSQNGGLEIERGTSTNASLIWSEASDYWVAGLAGAEERIVIGAGNTSITTLGTITTGTWNGSVIASAYLDSDTAHLSTTQTFSGAKTFSAITTVSNSTASTTKTTGALVVTGGVGISGALNVGGDVVAYASSDKRLKDNIKNIENPIEKVQALNGVTWDWNSNADELQQSLPNVGVIAQEVEEVFPQLVHDKDNGYKGVDYAKLTGLLIEAIKEQQKQIDELKSKLG